MKHWCSYLAGEQKKWCLCPRRGDGPAGNLRLPPLRGAWPAELVSNSLDPERPGLLLWTPPFYPCVTVWRWKRLLRLTWEILCEDVLLFTSLASQGFAFPIATLVALSVPWTRNMPQDETQLPSSLPELQRQGRLRRMAPERLKLPVPTCLSTQFLFLCVFLSVSSYPLHGIT